MKHSRKTPKRILSARLIKIILSLSATIITTSILWAKAYVEDVRIPHSEQPLELYANQQNDNLKATFQTAIESANNSILMITYSISDPTIIAALNKQAKSGHQVKVICDAKTSPSIEKKLCPQVELIKKFGDGLMHQKILIVDHEKVWLGSANMTSESLNMHGNLVYGIDNIAMASFIEQKATIHEGIDQFLPSHANFTCCDQTIELWWLPCDKIAVERLQKLINTAQKTVRVAMFTWTRFDLAKSVIDASKRNVDTEVVIDYRAGRGAGAKVVAYLKKNKIKVFLSRPGPLLHHKFLYIDGNILVNGSANWTKAAFTQNDDCFIVLKGLSEAQRLKMDQLWKTLIAESRIP